MKRYLPILAILLVIGFGLWIAYQQNVNRLLDQESSSHSSTEQNVNQSSESNQPQDQQLNIYFPMTNYESRITNRGHGKSITAADSEPLRCGDPFAGLHVGDDVEATEAELAQDVPVFSIADGMIKQVEVVDGYGGLIVIEHQIGGQIITAYYGHVDLTDEKLSIGGKVTAGQKLTLLGEDCSAETSNERMHLHFSIRPGTSLDVRGYVDTKAELDRWLNPLQYLIENKAKEPSLITNTTISN